jgi:hypothetical protein
MTVYHPETTAVPALQKLEVNEAEEGCLAPEAWGLPGEGTGRSWGEIRDPGQGWAVGGKAGLLVK